MKEKWRFGFFSQAQTSPWLERQKQALLGKPPNSSTADLTAQQTSLGRNQDSALWELEGNLGYQPVSVQFSSVAQSCPTLCDPMNCSMPGIPVHHHLPEFAQTHVHRVRDASAQIFNKYISSVLYMPDFFRLCQYNIEQN